MTTKAQLIEFINENYKDDETLLWQVVSKADVEVMLTGLAEQLDQPNPVKIPEDKWVEFVDFTEQYSVLASPYSEAAVDCYQDYSKGVL